MGPILQHEISLSETKLMCGIGRDDAFTHNECNPARQKLDLKDEDNLLNTFQSSKLFSIDASPDLHNIATQDMATKII